MLIRTENVDEEMPFCPGVTVGTGRVGDNSRKLPKDSEDVLKACTVWFGAYDS